ncbi:response regulator [Flavobacterium pallidum]|uniref:Response regulator n=1 Tax=Flavobacterium pallidum TaxID=2172098 RepID=A0A2S1SI67_9FLAO|nr:response regulator [Flavobacterium pallidum]AWI26103.1 response regulator [Flavobacterium pallidum]
MDKKKILIVDDDARNIFALTAVLKSRSYDCVSCQSALEALEMLKTDGKIDFILMDMMMPEMDGYEAIPQIRKIPSHAKTPIISVTAQAMLGDREKSLNAGADEYISKPVDIDKLLQVLDKL